MLLHTIDLQIMQVEEVLVVDILEEKERAIVIIILQILTILHLVELKLALERVEQNLVHLVQEQYLLPKQKTEGPCLRFFLRDAENEPSHGFIMPAFPGFFLQVLWSALHNM